MKVRYSKKSLKFLAKQEKSVINRIKSAIEKLTYNPPEGDIKEMQGDKKGKLRLRIGAFRVIFWYTEKNELQILYIDEIGNRGDIYKR